MEPIAAISTPYGKGGVALIRISGDGAIDIAASVFFPANRRPLADIKDRTSVFGSIRMPVPGTDEASLPLPEADNQEHITEAVTPDGTATDFRNASAESAAKTCKFPGADTSVSIGEEIDTGLCTIFRAPHSFTGEDTAEISCHGGVLVTSHVLAAVLASGARQALPGEFTRRAFLNGKMGLDAAEALGSLLDAKTGEQLRLAHTGMKGILGNKTAEIYRDLTHVLSSVFACIDYPDEDLAEMSREDMANAVRSIFDRLGALADTWKTGRAIMEGIPTVLLGRVNAGKSSLYNLLSGRDAAIVTDIAGTTRDVLTETLALGKVTLRLSDTAGIRETSDAVERIGVERALRASEEAGLLLAVFDASVALSEDDFSLIGRLFAEFPDIPVIAVLNKCDLPVVTDEARLRSAFGDCPPAAIIRLSARTGSGLPELTKTVENLFLDGSLDPATDAIVLGARQYAAILRARDAVGAALASIDAGYPVDLSCDDLENAMSALSELDGRAVSEDVVADIFSRFCVGK